MKALRTLAAVVLLCALTAPLWAEDQLVEVYVNGKLQSYKPAARVRDGVTYVPLRQGAVSLGFTVQWLAEQNGAKICDENGCLMIPKKNGIVVDGSMFLPLRKMAESFNANVTWDPAKKAVMIQKAAPKKLGE